MIVILSIFLAFMVGFTVRRSGICLVRATVEIMDGKPPKTMLFVMEAMSVALLITIPSILFIPSYATPAGSFELEPIVMIGGFVYGVGITMNGTCSMGTMNALCSGRLSYIATIVGFVVGYFLFLKSELSMPQTCEAYLSPDNGYAVLTLGLILLMVFGIVALRIRKFMRNNKLSIRKMLKRFVSSPISRDILAVFTLGMASGFLYLMGGSWDYTSWMMQRLIEFTGTESAILFDELALTSLALITGIVVATILSKGFSLNWETLPDYGGRFLGGMMMAFGAGLIPGGNDTLILYSLPGLAVHGFVALMMIVVGVMTVMGLTRLINRQAD